MDFKKITNEMLKRKKRLEDNQVLLGEMLYRGQENLSYIEWPEWVKDKLNFPLPFAKECIKKYKDSTKKSLKLF